MTILILSFSKIMLEGGGELCGFLPYACMYTFIFRWKCIWFNMEANGIFEGIMNAVSVEADCVAIEKAFCLPTGAFVKATPLRKHVPCCNPAIWQFFCEKVTLNSSCSATKTSKILEILFKASLAMLLCCFSS